MNGFISFLTSGDAGGLGFILLVVGGGIIGVAYKLFIEEYIPLVYIPVFIVGVLILLVAITAVGGYIFGQMFC